MKKILTLVAVAFLVAVSVNAQVMKSADLEKYAKERYGD